MCAKKFNGVSLILNSKWEIPGETVHSDACLTGIGAITEWECFHLELPLESKQQFMDINQIECFAILVAIRLWGHTWARKNLVFKCDNRNTVLALNSGVCRDCVMQNLLHNLHWQCVRFHIMIKAVFLPGDLNSESDCLSRWHLHSKYEQRFKRLVGNRPMVFNTVPSEMLKISEY